MGYVSMILVCHCPSPRDGDWEPACKHATGACPGGRKREWYRALRGGGAIRRDARLWLWPQTVWYDDVVFWRVAEEAARTFSTRWDFAPSDDERGDKETAEEMD